MDFDLAKKTTIESITQAGELLMANLGKVKQVKVKAKSDIATEIDLKAEEIIVSKIKKHFPSHAILSEEKGSIDGDSDYSWIIDPIDGTINYFYGHQPVRVGACLLEKKQAVLSVVYNPFKRDLYLAQRGQGTTLNGKTVGVSDNTELRNSIVMTHLSSRKEFRARTILNLERIFSKAMHMRIFGSGLASMSYIASGHFDVFFNVGTYPWDILPGLLLVEEAGGQVTDIFGKKITEDSTSVLATNGRVHEQMLTLLEDI